MDRRDYIKPEVQELVRVVLTSILVEENLTLKDVAEQAGVSYQMVYLFFGNKRRIGKESIKRFMHFATRYGYDASTLKKIDIT